jgi:hypothetical protein
MNSGQHEGSLLNAPKKKTSFFLVNIALRNYATPFEKTIFYDKLLASHKDLECIVSVHVDQQFKTNYRSSIRIELILDTRHMNPNKYDSLIVYQWINTLLRSMVGPEQKVPAKGELDFSLINDEDSYPEITIEKARPDRAIKKVTKYDFDPLYTNHFSTKQDFSEDYKIEHWARLAVLNSFDEQDPFLHKPGLTKSVAYLKDYFDKKMIEQKHKHDIK